MALGDGIRRNIASVDPAERKLLRDALLELNLQKFPGTRTDAVTSGDCSTGGVNLAGGVSQWFKQDEIHQATHVHHGPEFLPWHREIVNRLELMLRQINPQLSLHYWDWTQDPRNIPNANLGGGLTGPLNLFDHPGGPVGEFMGYGDSVPAPIGPPWQNAVAPFRPDGFYVPEANPHRDSSCNPADPPAVVNRSVVGAPLAPDRETNDMGTGILDQADYATMRTFMEGAHDAMHGFVRMGGQHISFRDPFVFLLHSNVDRLFARWQTDPAHPERLDPNTVYGSESDLDVKVGAVIQNLNHNIEPWSTGHAIDTFGVEHFTRPWFAPENEGIPKTYKHASIVTPPRYNTNVSGNPFRLAVITQSGDVFGAGVFAGSIGPVFQFSGAKIGFNPQDRFMVVGAASPPGDTLVRDTLVVITESGDVFGAVVAGRDDIGPVFQFSGGTKIGFNPQDRFMVAMSTPDRPGDGTLAVITQSGDVFGADIKDQNIGPVFQFSGAKIGFNPQDRFMVAMTTPDRPGLIHVPTSTLAVITQSGDVFGADVFDRDIGPVFQFSGAKIGFNPQDRFMVVGAPDQKCNTLVVITQSGDVFGAYVFERNIGPVFQFSGAKIGFNPQDRFMVALKPNQPDAG
jgi:hypothetical protein